MIKYSIITVNYNSGSGLQKTVESLLSQSYHNWELILKDCNSIDSSGSYIKSLDLCGDRRIKKHVSHDTGIYNAMNQALDYVSGDYILFMNSSDAFYQDNVLECIANHIANSNEPDIVYGQSLERYSDYEGYKVNHRVEYLLYGMIAHHQAIIYRNDIFRKYRYNEKYRIASDYDHLLKVWKSNVRFLKIDDIVCIFDMSGISTRNVVRKTYEDYLVKRENFGWVYIAIVYPIVLLFKITMTTIKKYANSLYARIRYSKKNYTNIFF